MRHSQFQNCTRKNENKQLSYSAVAQKNLSVKDLQRQILTLQKQVLKLTMLLAKQKPQKRAKKSNKTKLVRATPATKSQQVSHVVVEKWQSCKRFTVSRKNLPPSKAIAYAVVEGRYYLKLVRREVCPLSKVTRLTYRGVHLTSKKTIRAILSGESVLRLPEKQKSVRRERQGAKRDRGEKVEKCPPQKLGRTKSPTDGPAKLIRVGTVMPDEFLSLVAQPGVKIMSHGEDFLVIHKDKYYYVGLRDTKNYEYCKAHSSGEYIEGSHGPSIIFLH